MKYVYHKGSKLIVNDVVFEHFGLTQNQNASEAMFWNIIEMNAQIGIAMCKTKI